MSQLGSPVWSLLHAAPRNQAALLWLLLYDPIFTFRNGIIFSEGQNNFGPFALVQRHYREHHGQSMIGSCSSAGSAEWRWGRRRVHDLAHRRDCGENTGGIPDQDLISVWGKRNPGLTVRGICIVSLNRFSSFTMLQMYLINVQMVETLATFTEDFFYS